MTLIWLAAALAVAQDGAVDTAASDAPTPPTLRIIATGATGGVGSGRYDLDIPESVRAALASRDAEIRSVVAHHGVLSRDDAALIAADRRADTVAAFLQADSLSCGDARPAEVQIERDEIALVDEASAPGLAGALEATPALARKCTVDGLDAWLIHGLDTAVPTDLTGFEFRLGLTVEVSAGETTERFEILGRPDREATRRIGAVRQILTDDPGALFVDAGSFVDGPSAVSDGKLSLHRPTGYSVLRDLAPAALAPGRTELAEGAVAFAAEASGLPYTAANWEAAEGVPDLPASIRVSRPGADIAFVGFIDPEWLRWVPADEGVVISDPVAAVQAEVDRLRATEPPEAIVVIGEASAELLRRLQRGLTDVDVIIGDSGPPIDGVHSLEWEVREPWAPEPPPAATLPLDGVIDATLVLGSERVEAIRAEPIRITTALTPDLAVLEKVNAVRAETYPRLDVPLLPAPDDPTTALSHDTWTKLVCESVLETTDADLALLPELPVVRPTPGPLTELLVVDRLALLDELVVHEIPGDRFGKLLDKAFENVPTHCGAPLGERFPKAKGRSLEAERSYTVVTTDRTLADGTLRGLLDEAHSPWVLDARRAQRPVLTEDGSPLTLRAATLDVLREIRDHGKNPIAELSARSHTDFPPMWTLRSRILSFSLERFQGAGDTRYASFPETLATSPSSTTLNTTADLALEHSSRSLLWDLRWVSMYSQLTTSDDQQEPADDLRLSTSGSLPGASFPVGNLAFMPYTELLFDSEFTAVESEDGTLNPLQRDASLTLGLSTKRAAVLRAFRVGGFGLRDLTVPEKPTEFGARTNAEIRLTLGSGMYWTTWLDAFVWADTPTADASDLRFKALVDTRVQLALARWLNTAVYAQSFSFAGRLPETSKVGHAMTVGAALDVVGAFRL